MEFLKEEYKSSSEEKEIGETFQIAPNVIEKFPNKHFIDQNDSELMYNPKFEELYTPLVGPDNPKKTNYEKSKRNVYTGHIQESFVNEIMFEEQRINFTKNGTAIDPSFNTTGKNIVKKLNRESDIETDFRIRKREPRGEASDVENFKGPWANYKDINLLSKPTPEQILELEKIESEKQRIKAENIPTYNFDFRKRNIVDESLPDPKNIEEKFTLHMKNPYDYQGRSFLYVPTDTGSNLKSTHTPTCHYPKNHIFTWKAHAKGVSRLILFPKSGHLALSGGLEGKIKLWQMYNERQQIMTFDGHCEAIKDLCFTNDGTHFISCSLDRWMKLWDTERGQCIQRFTNNKVPYCIKFHPDEDKQHLFVAGMLDYKISTWDTRENQIVQEYDRHLGPVNSITFYDDNMRMLTTSDDKSIRLWEWDIPIDTRHIARSGLDSLVSVTVSPDGHWLAGQSVGDKIFVFDIFNRIKEKKKVFFGHNTLGQVSQPAISPDGRFIMIGDNFGKLNMWDWEKAKLVCKFEAHKKLVPQCEWLPHEESKILTASWDGTIKLWG